MRFLLFLFCMCAITVVSAQAVITGKITDESGAPVAGASVFLNTTSIGTYSAADGSFSLPLPQGRYELVVSSVSYQTHTQSVGSSQTAPITIVLKIKAKELEAVTVGAFDPDGWRNWGAFFIENFMGTSSVSRSCQLQNPQVLRFRYDKKKGLLTAVATAPLVIESKALGYTLTYQLEEFMFDFNRRYIFFTGYPFFTPHKGSAAQQRRWERRRADSYLGSLQHFMRSLYRNRLVEEGFEVRRMKKVKNEGGAQEGNFFQRPSTSVQHQQINVENEKPVSQHITLRRPGLVNVAEQTPVSGDSIAYALDSVTAALDFPDYLLVTYTKARALPDYRHYHKDAGDAQTSELTLLHKKPLEVYANGSFFAPDNLLTSGYWGWREKVGNMLPYDYKLPKAKAVGR